MESGVFIGSGCSVGVSLKGSRTEGVPKPHGIGHPELLWRWVCAS